MPPPPSARHAVPGDPAFHTSDPPAVTSHSSSPTDRPDDAAPPARADAESPRPSSDEGIRDLVARNPGQCTLEEYTLIRDRIVEQAPCSLLVFGVGRDTPLWLDANRGGRTVFLESKREWIDFTREKQPEAEVVRVRYSTRRFLWRWLLDRPKRLAMELPDAVRDTSWDVILVDGPKGKSWYYPGRMQSIYTASVLAADGAPTDVLVHDCHRTVEQVYSDTYLGGDALVAEVHHLRHYRVD